MSDQNQQPNPEAAGAPEAKPARKRRARLIFGGVLLAALVIGGLWYGYYQFRGKYFQSTDDAYIQSDAVVVSSKVSGFVDRVFVADNQQVKAGQPLVEIDARDYGAQAAQAQAQIDVAAANAAGVEAQIHEQGAAIAQARAQLAQAEADLAFAQGQVKRYAPLAETGAESGEHLAQLRTNAQQAAAQVAAARAALDAAQRRVGALQAQVGQAKAQGEAARAQLAAANVNVGATIIRASVDGRVGDKSVRVGQFVQPGLRMMSVVPLSQLYVVANFKETQVGLMRVGQPVELKVDALSGVALRGHVESFSPGTGAQFSLLPPQNATGNFTKIVQRVPVRIAIDVDPQTRALLLPGMSVEVDVDTLSARGSKEAIARRQEALYKAGK